MHTINAHITPKTNLRVLSRHEVSQICDINSKTYELFRRCAFAVLNCGSNSDDYLSTVEQFRNFDIRVNQEDRGITLDVKGAPPHAFVDGEIIRGIREHLFSVLRDILYTADSVVSSQRFNLNNSEDITNATFHILRNANILQPNYLPRLVVCWGGHSIPREEYDYSKKVGYELGLRGLDVGTGCGPGAMKGPMKGATIGHAKQHIKTGRYIGITEPGIIAAEAPNPIVNELVILPDIEKRLESFIRLSHGIIVFPGGPGTLEEILYLLGILLHPDNIDIPFPVILTGPAGSEEYFDQVNNFIGLTLGKKAQQRYDIVIDDQVSVAKKMKSGLADVLAYRKSSNDAFFYNWGITIANSFQQPFAPTHENMASLEISKSMPLHELAANLRRAFSGIVAGNVKEEGVMAVKKYGVFKIKGDPDIMNAMDNLLTNMSNQGRMKINGNYIPCYEIVK
ncbi:MAG TPA: LOG family protein [Oceanospirillales bacterium]|jgi:predicted Rossmann-fold nucleotide-binding protein|nr:LOG family protein [Oceanospirillales bacterium]|tara:strand:+ start:816 stop:2174 length:1359 start_codon:yes stop_codon:yes gene_type:complete